MAGEKIGVGPFDFTPPNRARAGADGHDRDPQRPGATAGAIEDLDTDEMILNMGPQHPSTHGVLRLELRTDGEVVQAARPHIGYLHRCFEKHAENVDYPGVIPYTDRMDYVASMGNSLGYALAVEKLMGIEVSPYVQTIRVIMAELQRIASHCVAVGTYGMDIGAFTPFLHLLRDREKILDLFEWTCGARLLYNYNWVGGVSHDLPEGFVRACRQFLREFERHHLPRADGPADRQQDLHQAHGRHRRVPAWSWRSPTTSPAPTCAAAASPRDLRKDEPYCGYENYEFDVPRGQGRVRPARLLLRPQLGARGRDGGEREDPAPGPRRGSRRWRRPTSTRRCRSA